MSSCRPSLLLHQPTTAAGATVSATSILLVVAAQLLTLASAAASYDDYNYGSHRAGVPSTRHEPERQMVCNNGTDYQCICRTGTAPADAVTAPPIIECDQFIQSRELPVVDMRLRHVNLEAHLHTNEKYETYFKRRIANIVSSYCEHQANECPGATLRLTQTVSDASQSDDDDDDKSVLYAADDESEPLLTQNNVVLLRVEREPVNVTRILFAITKSENVGSLNEQMIIDPVKVKYILGSQAGPLARILGGIKLDSVRVSRIRRHLKPSDTDNTKLITIISIVGAFFVICYIIGAIRLCRDARRRKRERKAAEDAANGLATVNAVPNYGACQRKPSKNGAVKHTVGKEIGLSSYTEIDESVNNNHHNDEPHVLTERQARFMFMCDPSQLPREPTFDSESAMISEPSPKSNVPLEKKENRVSEEKPASSEEKASSDEPPQQQKAPSPPSEVPALVLVPSFSLESPITSDESPATAEPSSGFLINKPESPDRPKSRRGSRVGDEVLDLREVGASPEEEPNNNYGQRVQEVVVNVDDKAPREHELNRWSSSEGEVDVYYKLSDDEDMIRGDDWSNLKASPLPENKLRQEDSDSDADEDDDDERYKPDSEVDGYVYERLREELTPVPPDS